MHQPPDQLERDLAELFHATPTHGDPALTAGAERAATGRRRRRDLGTALGSGLAVAALVGGLYVVPHLVDVGRAGGGPIAVGATGSESGSATLSPGLEATPTATPSAIIPDWPSVDPTLVAPPPTAAPGLIPRSIMPTATDLAMPAEQGGAGMFESAAGAATLMGLHICDTIVVSQRLGSQADAAVRPLVSANQSFVDARETLWGNAVDVTVSVMPEGTGAKALAELGSNTGFCIWYPDAPTIEQADADLVRVSRAGPDGSHTAGVARVAGDVLIGVVVTKATAEDAMSQAESISASVADKARAAMPQAKG